MPKQNKLKEKVAETLKPLDGVDDFDMAKEPRTSAAGFKGTTRISGARVIPIDKVKPDPNQPRKSFPEDSLKDLADSIKAHGILQPITAEYLEKEDSYKIIVGERRYQAAKLVGLKEIPCLIQEGIEENTRSAVQLVENLQREDLSPVEKARAIIAFKGQVGSWEKVDELTGLSPRRRQHYTAILKLPEEIQNTIVSTGRKPAKTDITEKHARALLALKKDPEKQKKLFELMLDKKNPLSGDQAVDQAKRLKGKPQVMTFVVRYSSKEDLIQKLEEEIERLKAGKKKRT